MSEIDGAAIRKIVRAMAAKELVDRRIVADLLFQIGIIPRLTSWENKKMDFRFTFFNSIYQENLIGMLYTLKNGTRAGS